MLQLHNQLVSEVREGVLRPGNHLPSLHSQLRGLQYGHHLRHLQLGLLQDQQWTVLCHAGLGRRNHGSRRQRRPGHSVPLGLSSVHNWSYDHLPDDMHHSKARVFDRGGNSREMLVSLQDLHVLRPDSVHFMLLPLRQRSGDLHSLHRRQRSDLLKFRPFLLLRLPGGLHLRLLPSLKRLSRSVSGLRFILPVMQNRWSWKLRQVGLLIRNCSVIRYSELHTMFQRVFELLIERSYRVYLVSVQTIPGLGH